jgi:hypothetical protein
MTDAKADRTIDEARAMLEANEPAHDVDPTINVATAVVEDLGNATTLAAVTVLLATVDTATTTQADAIGSSADAVSTQAASAETFLGVAANLSDGLVASGARVAENAEPYSGTVGNQSDGGPLPIEGVWVNPAGSPSSNPNSTRTISISDPDHDGYPDIVGDTVGLEPRSAASYEAETLGNLAPYSAGADPQSGGGLVPSAFTVYFTTALTSDSATASVSGAADGAIVQIRTVDSGAPLLGNRTIEACGPDATSLAEAPGGSPVTAVANGTGPTVGCALDPDGSGQDALNHLLLNSDPTEPSSPLAGREEFVCVQVVGVFCTPSFLNDYWFTQEIVASLSTLEGIAIGAQEAVLGYTQ